jgi:hypothetical protein
MQLFKNGVVSYLSEFSGVSWYKDYMDVYFKDKMYLNIPSVFDRKYFDVDVMYNNEDYNLRSFLLNMSFGGDIKNES